MEYWIDEDLLDGNNDGSEEANAYRSWDEGITGIGSLTEDSTILVKSTGAVVASRNLSGLTMNGFALDIVAYDGAVLATNTAYSGAININEDGASLVTIKNFTIAGGYNSYGVYLLWGQDIKVVNLRFIGASSKRAIYHNASSGTITVDGLVAVWAQYAIGLSTNTGGVINASNCYGHGTTEAYNAGNGTLNLDHCASSDTTGSTGLQNIPYDATTFINVSSGSEDFTLAENSPLIGAGIVTDSTTDIDGVSWGTPRDIGVKAYTTAFVTIDFSYNDIEAGFSGYFNLSSDPTERRFGSNACWFGIITGASAELEVSRGTSPFGVFVDGAASVVPTVTDGKIPLFTGLEDGPHTVCIVCKLSAHTNYNGISTEGTSTVKVTGSTPAVTNLPFALTSDPAFRGINTYSKGATGVAELTPTFDEIKPWGYERGQIIVDAQCDEIWLFSDAAGCFYSIDGADPTQVTFPEPHTVDGYRARRAVQLASSLDYTAVHRYTIWASTDESYGTQGVAAVLDGVITPLTEITDEIQKVLFVGGSVVNGTAGSLAGEADTWEVGRRLGLAMVKAGNNGHDSVESLTDLASIIAANGVPDVAIFGSSTNDSGSDPDLQAHYEALINGFLSAGIETVICRGVVPYLQTQHDTLEAAVAATGNPDVHFVSSFGWDTYETIDGVHPTATGYEQLSDYEIPGFEAILTIYYHLSDVTYDKNGNVLPSCNLYLFKFTNGIPAYVATQVSDSVTGAYDFTGLIDDNASYMIVAHKEGSPNLFDVSDKNLKPVEVA